MATQQNKMHKRYEKNGERSFFERKRLRSKLKLLPIPGTFMIHLLAIALYIAYEVLISINNGEQFSMTIYAVFYLVFVSLFYLNAHVLYPTIKSFKHTILIILLLLLHATVIVFILLLLNHMFRFYLTGEMSLRTPSKTLINTIWRCITLMSISGIYWLVLHLLEQKRREIYLLKRQRDAENREFLLQIAYDNARMNPHFLFNTLQYVYQEVESISPKAEAAIAGLSDMVRYSFNELSEDGKMPLVDELSQVERFIELNRQRFAERFHFHYLLSLDSDFDDLRIPPHMLLVIAENMIKHGVITDPERPAELSVNLTENILTIISQNHKRLTPKQDGTGVGISNLQSRLGYLYLDRHSIDIKVSALRTTCLIFQ